MADKEEPEIIFPEIGFFNSFKPVVLFFIVFIIAFIKASMAGTKCPCSDRLPGKVALVTGGSMGMGLQIALDLAKRGARVILTSRSFECAKRACDYIRKETHTVHVVPMVLDLSSFASIRGFVEEFLLRENRLDILVNNAGVMMPPNDLTEDGFDYQFQVNYLGHFLLTSLLLDILRSSSPSRIVNVSATAYQLLPFSFDDLKIGTSSESYKAGDAYSRSKLAIMLTSRKMGQILEGTGVAVITVHPGVVRTNCHRYMAFNSNIFLRYTFMPITWLLMKSPSDGAQTTIYAAVSPELEDSQGRYYVECREELLSANALDDRIADKLWEYSTREVGVDDISSKLSIPVKHASPIISHQKSAVDTV